MILQKILAEINKLVNENNYSLRDIAILCNSRKRVALTAQFLTNNTIDVVSNEGLLLHSSEKVKLLVSSFYYLQDQDDEIAKASIIECLQKTVLSKNNLHKLNSKLHQDKSFLQLIKEAGLSFPIPILTELPLYEMTEQIIRNLKVNEDVYVQFFLDVVLRYTEKNGSSISEFLLWWEDVKTKEAIVVPEETNAVQIMTIHKAKGLAFNVVMIPFNWEDVSNKKEIWVDTSKHYQKLKSALINSSKTLELSYFSNEYKKEKELAQDYREKFASPYIAASKGYIDAVIFPSETRQYLLKTLLACQGKRMLPVRRKHGNIPL